MALTVLPLIGLAVAAGLVGWSWSTQATNLWLVATRAICVTYGALYLYHELRVRDRDAPFRTREIVFMVMAGLLVITSAAETFLPSHTEAKFLGISAQLILISLAALQSVVLFSIRIPAWLPFLERTFFQRFSPGLILVVTFAILITLGTLALKMPNCTTTDIGWIDALFTSTSAVCVTGLTTVNPATTMSVLGQIVILALIQVGAFGIVTLTFFLAVLSGQGFSVASRVFLGGILSLERLRDLNAAVAFIVTFSLGAELVGAGLLLWLWSGELGWGLDAAWAALFHSVSAFCNAGFSLFEANLADPRVVGNVSGHVVIMGLIIAGGLGFPVIMEASRLAGVHARRIIKGTKVPVRLSIHLRLVVISTVCLIAIGTVLVYLGSFGRESEVFRPSLWQSLFHAVAARTAGYNLSDLGLLPPAAAISLILLMFIGGSPGGVAGGVKTTTIAVALLNLRRILLGRDEIRVFRRRLNMAFASRAFAVLLLSQAWILVATMAILFAQPHFTFIDVLFEVTSAFATVGLSRGLTPQLSDFSKLVIVATMFAGRIGILNFFFSFLSSFHRESHTRLPEERILIE